MKKKNINHLLLNSLISIDFLLYKKHYFLNNLSVFNVIKLNKKLFMHLLNPLDIIINLKQFFRVIQFFKKQKAPVFNFFVQGNHQKSIINNFLVLNKLNLKFKIFFKFLALKKKASSQFLLLLKDYFYKQSTFSKTILNKNCFLIQEINASKIQNNMNTYKMFNEISDYKKLIFILVFIRQI